MKVILILNSQLSTLNSQLSYMQGIKKIVYVDGITNSPAGIYVKTGVCLINLNRIDDFTPDMWEWILNHESAHAEFQTGNEFFVDRIAFNRQLFKGRSMKEIITQSRKFLDINKPECAARINAMLSYGYKITQQLQQYNLDYSQPEQRIIGMNQYKEELFEELHNAFEAKDVPKVQAIVVELRAIASEKSDIDLLDNVLAEIEGAQQGLASATGRGYFSHLKQQAIAKATHNQLYEDLHEAFHENDAPKIELLVKELRAAAKHPSDINFLDNVRHEIHALKGKFHSAKGSGFLSKLQQKAADKKAAKEQRKQERHEANMDMKSARIDKVRHTGEAKLELAKHGIDSSIDKKQLVGTILKVAAPIAGIAVSASGGGGCSWVSYERLN